MDTPIWNHLVLEKIMGNLNFDDLKNCRLVCRFWNEITRPFLTIKGRLYLEGNGLERYLQALSTQTDIPRVHFENCDIKISSVLSTEKNIGALWSEMHYSIKILSLHITTAYAVHNLETLLLQKLPSLNQVKLVITKFWGPPLSNQDVFQNVSNQIEPIEPNRNLHFFQLSYLGSISLYGFPEGDDDGFAFPLHWEQLFQRFPDLNHLSLIGLDISDISKMLQALLDKQMRNNMGSINLKSLEILDENIFPESPNDDHLNKISCLKIPFESLHLELSPLTTSSLLTNIIEKYQNSLKTLRLRRYPHPHISVPITFTNIDLRLLTLLEVSDCVLPSLSFLPLTPALKTLNIILRDYRHLPYCEIVQNTPNISRVTHLGLKNLYIEPALISKDCIQKLTNCFPNLEALRLRVNNEMFEEICSAGIRGGSWKNLKSLYITSWDGLTDEGITGINQQILKFWGGYSSFEAKKHRCKPYIGNITGLENLTIEMWSDYENHISDWAIYYGIMDLENLQKIRLIRAGVTSKAFKLINVKNKRIVH